MKLNNLPHPDDWLDFGQAAQLINCTRKQIQQAVAVGRKIGDERVKLQSWITAAGHVTTADALQRYHDVLNWHRK